MLFPSKTNKFAFFGVVLTALSLQAAIPKSAIKEVSLQMSIKLNDNILVKDLEQTLEVGKRTALLSEPQIDGTDEVMIFAEVESTSPHKIRIEMERTSLLSDIETTNAVRVEPFLFVVKDNVMATLESFSTDKKLKNNAKTEVKILAKGLGSSNE